MLLIYIYLMPKVIRRQHFAVHMAANNRRFNPILTFRPTHIRLLGLHFYDGGVADPIAYYIRCSCLAPGDILGVAIKDNLFRNLTSAYMEITGDAQNVIFQICQVEDNGDELAFLNNSELALHLEFLEIDKIHKKELI